MEGGAPNGVSCPSESTVAGFLEYRLSIEQRAELEAHIDSCASCRRLVIELSSGLQLLSVVAEAHTTHPARPTGRGEILAKGTVVGRFVVLDVLGAGGMGVVYLAYDPTLDRKVALKLLRPVAMDTGDPRAQLLAEAQVMARVSHANVIAVYDVGSYREQVFAAMELVEGPTLRRWMAERSHSWREVVDVFLRAGEGLAAAHAAGVIHRDFKPENVLLGRDGRVKVSDFGLAAVPSLRGGHVAGTPGYLPVEGLRTGNIDERGDQFSFCVALHEALHGRRPFAARGADELVAEIRRGPVPEPGKRVPGRLTQVVRRGLALAPEDRHRSMAHLLGDLRRAVAVHRMRQRMAAVVATLTLVIGATVLVMDTRAAATQPPCSGAAAHLVGVWDRARRDAVRAAFVRTATPGAAASFERAAAVIDRYAADWVAIRTEACEATEVRRAQPAALLELRMACLDRARIQLRALGDALVSAGADTVRDAAAGAGGLPALDACSDVDALQTIASAPLRFAARSHVPTPAGPADEPIAPAGVIGDDGNPLISRPVFRLPFGCGEAWRITGPARGAPGGQADFDLPGGEPAADFTIFASAPGWVSRVNPDNGQVEISHGDGWFTTYQHMTDISVSLHQYVGRGRAIGRVGNVNVRDSLGGVGPARLHYEQLYQPGVASADLAHGHGGQSRSLYLEGETLPPSAGVLVRTSTNNCFGGGAPGGATQYDVPTSTRVFSRSRATVEIMTRRSEDHALFERWYDRGWNGAAMPHTIVGQPAVAVFDGDLHVLARKADGTIFDLRYSPFDGWRASYLDGRVSGDPDVAVYSWNKNLHAAARGADGYLYHWWTGANGAWSRAVRISNVEVAGAPALMSHYDALYIVARAADGSLRSWEADRRGLWTAWQLRGAAADDPDIGVDPRSGRVNVVARGPDNRLYRWQSNDLDRDANHASRGWSDPELIDAGHPVTGAPATIVHHGVMHIFARGPDNAVDHWWGDQVWHREATGGAYSGSLDAFTFDDQLHTVGRGTRGDLYSVWYDPVSGLWNLENQHTAVSE